MSRRMMMQSGGVKLELPPGFTEVYGVHLQKFATKTNSTHLTRLESEIKFTLGAYCNYGGRLNSPTYYGLFNYGNRFDWLYYTESSYTISISSSQWYKVIHGYKDGVPILEIGTTKRTFKTKTFNSSIPIYLFGSNEFIYNGGGVFRRTSLFLEDKMVEYYIPCTRDSDGKVCMWECFYKRLIVGDSTAYAVNS